MGTVTVKENILELPSRIARKLRGKNMFLEEIDQGILLKYTDDPIRKAKGFLKDKGFTTEKYLAQKKQEIGHES